jgi:hypothetical protein
VARIGQRRSRNTAWRWRKVVDAGQVLLPVLECLGGGCTTYRQIVIEMKTILHIDREVVPDTKPPPVSAKNNFALTNG